MAVLANLASGGTSWRVLCPSRNGLEGGGVETSRSVVVRTLARGCGRREAVGRTTADVVASCHPVPHSVGDGDAVPGMVFGRRGWLHRTNGD
jgi:hypothetical protein